MSSQNLVVIMAIIVVLMAWYANSSKKNKIYCQFTRVNKTEVHRFVKMTSRYVIFDGRKYDIIPHCVKWLWWDKGIGMFFPQTVAKMDFVWNNRFPVDPNTGEPTIISPEVREKMDKEEWVKSYAKGFAPPSNKKGTAMQQYLPYVTILLIVVVAVYVYTNMQAIGQHLAIIDNTLRAITK